ncbi:MAG: rane fusion protein hemolysin [Methylobacteriaceae bacterium]|jgi:hemolysin D|nr:rane fusion protein hemolysin [Methylobacteriaceae bacterium]
MTLVTNKDLVPAKASLPVRAFRISDHEFLPAALEILETPPSPVRIGLLAIICVFAATALTWSYFGRIDIIATAQGKFQPTGRVKVIQPLDTGKVLASHVENGKHVSQGDVLVELDPSEGAAEVAEFTTSLASYRAEALRRHVAIEAARAKQTAKAPPVGWGPEIPQSIRLREERVIASDLGQLNAQVASLNAQANQKRAERERLDSTIVAQKQLVATQQERVQMRSSLVEKNAGSRADLLNAVETMQYQQTALAQQIGQLREAEANLAVIARDTEKAYETFMSDNAQKLAEAERQADDYGQKLVKSVAKLDHMTLRAPMSGTIQASSVTTVGQVLTSGEEIMRIVPEDAVLEIESYLPNQDIGFVKEGQDAVVKIESFPFTRYGTINARVTRVARDAIPQPEAEQTETNAAKTTRSTNSGTAQRTQNLVFPVTLKPETTLIGIDGTNIPLQTGMATTVEIRTGSRRILEYIFSPLVQIGSEAMKER